MKEVAQVALIVISVTALTLFMRECCYVISPPPKAPFSFPSENDEVRHT